MFHFSVRSECLVISEKFSSSGTLCTLVGCFQFMARFAQNLQALGITEQPSNDSIPVVPKEAIRFWEPLNWHDRINVVNCHLALRKQVATLFTFMQFAHAASVWVDVGFDIGRFYG